MLSIIIPVYNVEKYLHSCIQSILNQTISDFELILVNDGSIDSSGLICDTYKMQDNRIKVIHQENRGVSAARNAGLKISQGRYIGFVDSDDWIESDMYEKMLLEIRKSEADICICSCRYEGEKILIEYDGKDELISSQVALEKIIRGKFPASLDISLYKRDILSGNFLNENIHYWEDLEYQIRAIIKAENISIIKEPLYHVRERAGSTTRVRVNQKNMSSLFIIDELNASTVKLYQKYIDAVACRLINDLSIGISRRGAEDKKTYNNIIKRYARNIPRPLNRLNVNRNQRIFLTCNSIMPSVFQYSFKHIFHLRMLLKNMLKKGDH